MERQHDLISRIAAFGPLLLDHIPDGEFAVLWARDLRDRYHRADTADVAKFFDHFRNVTDDVAIYGDSFGTAELCDMIADAREYADQLCPDGPNWIAVRDDDGAIRGYLPTINFEEVRRGQ